MRVVHFSRWKGKPTQSLPRRSTTTRVVCQDNNNRHRGVKSSTSYARVFVEEHRHEGLFIVRGKEDALVTRNMVVGQSVYGEKRVQIGNNATGEKFDYRVWNPFRSKLAAAILGGIEHIYIRPGCKVLYLGAASGTSVSHVSDIVGPSGFVYAVEFSHRAGRDLVSLAKNRRNIVPIIEDARRPERYRMIVPMVDVIFADIAQPDQARILGCNAEFFSRDRRSLPNID